MKTKTLKGTKENKISENILTTVVMGIGGYFGWVVVRDGFKKLQGTEEQQASQNSQEDDNYSGNYPPRYIFPLQRVWKHHIPYDPVVRQMQIMLLQLDPQSLPRYGADGQFGPETEAAVLRRLGKNYVSYQDFKRLKKDTRNLNGLGCGACMGMGTITEETLLQFQAEGKALDHEMSRLGHTDLLSI